MKVKRTERGWGGHFIGAFDCSFRRNTLLEYGDARILVSTVGCYRSGDEIGLIEIGHGRYYETMAFTAVKDGAYWEADVSRELSFDSEWCIAEVSDTSDNEANDMHEAVVAEFMQKLQQEGRKPK